MYADKDLIIDKEFEKLIPPLTKEEYNTLQENCLNDGIREPISKWNNIIIDGHNRFNISKNNGWLDFETVDYTERFQDRGQVIEWMLNNQLGRRNLNPDQLSIIRGKLYNLHKLGRGGDRKSKGQNDTLKNTAQDMADKYKVSERTIKRDGQFVKNNPEIADKILRGETTKKDAVKEMRKQKTQEKIKAQEAEKIPANIKLIAGDLFYNLESIPDHSIDLLCTDPPYFVLSEEWDKFGSLTEFLLFTEKWIKAVIPKVKPKTGRIYISFAFDYMFHLYNILDNNKFFGFNCYGPIIWVKKNNNQKFDRRGYRLNYEPIMYLYGPECDILNFTEYGEIQSNVWEIATPQTNFKEGKRHPAQKPLELYRRIISTGSKVNDNVLDCFAGSGTTGVICKELNRNCILIERNPDYINIIKERLTSVGV